MKFYKATTYVKEFCQLWRFVDPRGLLYFGALLSVSAFAMPDPSKGIPAILLKKIESHPGLKGSVILRDSNNSEVIYVGPASKKTSSGGLVFTDYVGNCSAVEKQFGLTYLLPNVPNEQWPALALNRRISPYFEYSYAESLREAETLNLYKEYVDKNYEIQMKNKEVLENYNQYKVLYDHAVESEIKVENRIKALDLEIERALRQVQLASGAEELKIAHEGVAAAREERRVQLPELRIELREASKNREKLAQHYASAYAKAKPYLLDMEEHSKRYQFVRKILDDTRELWAVSHKRNEETLQRMTSTPVGKASAGYNVYGNEVQVLAAIISSFGSDEAKLLESALKVKIEKIQVSKLPLNNVKILMGGSRSEIISADASGAAPDLIEKLVVSSKGNVAVDHEQGAETYKEAGFKTKEGDGIQVKIQKVQNDGAGVVQALVTRGSYCMNQSEGEIVEHTALDANKEPVMFTGYKYSPRKRVFLHQPIALSYDYFVKAEPISVNCQLNVAKFNSFVREAGTKGWFFKKRTWDNTERELIKNQGVVCNIEDSPTMLSEEEKIIWKNETLQNMMQEVMAEYTLQFASSWTLLTRESVVIPKSTHQIVGPSVQALCGGNLYCQIGNVVWKTAEELFGNRAGHTGNRDILKGVIRREYNESGYRLIPHSTQIDVVVSL